MPNSFKGGSEMRRKWMDAVISQYDRTYLEALIDVNKALVQRNALLRYFAENRTFDAGLLAPWNARIAPKAAVIAKARRSFVDSFLPGFLADVRRDLRWCRAGGADVDHPCQRGCRGHRGQDARRPRRGPSVAAHHGRGAQRRRGVHLGRPCPEALWKPRATEVVLGGACVWRNCPSSRRRQG